MVEFSDDIKARIKYIQECKQEVELRLRLLRPARIGNLDINIHNAPQLLALHKEQCVPDCPWTPSASDNWGGLIGTIFPKKP